MKRLVSIIVPAYNIESYIARCLESILNQTYKTIEVIVVDDGSSDRTCSIADRYASTDSRVRVIHQQNSGVSTARNRGIAEAKGDYIGFIDGDDWIEPEMYETLVRLLEEHDADIAHCGYQMVFPNRTDYYHNTKIIKIQDRYDGLNDLLGSSLVEPALVNKLYKRKVLLGVRLSHNIRINEDLLFNYEAFKNAKKAVFYDVPLYHYMIRNGSATSGTNQLIIDSDCISVARTILKDNDPMVIELAYRRYIYFLMSTCRKKPIDITYKEFQKEKRKELVKEMKTKMFKEHIHGKLKYMSIGSAYFSYIFRIFYRLYDLKTGTSLRFRIK